MAAGIPRLGDVQSRVFLRDGWFNELPHLQKVDFSRTPHAVEFGPYGAVKIRYGKAKKGSPSKRRTAQLNRRP
jgi:hypothetical protein